MIPTLKSPTHSVDHSGSASSPRPAPVTPPWWRNAESSIPARRKEVRDYQIDGEAVLFDPKTRKMYLLNQTALTVFRRCDGLTTMRQVAESLTNTYHVAMDSALDHVEHLVGVFAASSLLDVKDCS